jgi:hypothetical protein
MNHPYVGSGPYCYANAFAMMFGDLAPSVPVIEFATCSSFGMQLIGGRLPFFDPYGWTPELGFDHALDIMGWTSTVTTGGDAQEAIARLRNAVAAGPAWVGPVEMGHLRYQPGMTGPVGADHYVIVLDVQDDSVILHDPEGYPYSSLPLEHFLAAWRAESLSYGSPFTMRTGFRQLRDVPELEIVRAAIPSSMAWLSMRGSFDMPSGSSGNAEAAGQLADLIADGCDTDLRDHLIQFAIRVGARRRSDAATCMLRAGLHQAAGVFDRQARLIGALQYPMVTGDTATAARILRRLAPTHPELHEAIASQT